MPVRRTLYFALSSCVLLAASCASRPRVVSHPQVVPTAIVRAQHEADRRRLIGDNVLDASGHRKMVAGVDVTGQTGWTEFWHVITGFPKAVSQYLSGDTPIRAARYMEDSTSPDARRYGILRLASFAFGRRGVYTTRYAQIAQLDTDPLVRAAAIRALDWARVQTDSKLFISALDEREPLDRLEAAKALANIPNDSAATPLMAHLRDDADRDVRIACADALREYRTNEVARALIGVLPEKEFGVAWQAHHSLVFMTGHDFRYDDAAWLQYLVNAKQPFVNVTR